MLLSDSCGRVSVGRPLWRENGSAICSEIIQCSESRRTHNHTLLSHLRVLQPGGPGSRIYIPQEQGDPVIPLGAGFPLCRVCPLPYPVPVIQYSLMTKVTDATEQTSFCCYASRKFVPEKGDLRPRAWQVCGDAAAFVKKCKRDPSVLDTITVVKLPLWKIIPYITTWNRGN
jgi:hypothetical protein